MTYHPIESKKSVSSPSSLVALVNGAGAVGNVFATGTIWALAGAFCVVSMVLKMNGQSGEGSIGPDGLSFKIGPIDLGGPK